MEKIDRELIAKAKAELLKVKNNAQLQKVKADFLGKKGPLATLFNKIKKVPATERKEFGQKLNALKGEIAALFTRRQQELEQAALQERLTKEKIDITLPGHGPSRGTKHPCTRIIELLTAFFVGYGYQVKEGPEVETDDFNFTSLNIPIDHPARDMQDSFFISDKLLLRSHTSPVQARTLQDMAQELPLKIICPGKVYRRDNDATHSHQFSQIEGLVVGPTVTLANLTKTLEDMFRYLFGPKVEVRFRPSYFPFTEPSLECDVSCFECHGKGCNLCKRSGWIEVLGAGMVNPQVFRLNGIDAQQWQGFAFGIGVERIAMLLYGIDDIHRFYQNDDLFLAQFAKE